MERRGKREEMLIVVLIRIVQSPRERSSTLQHPRPDRRTRDVQY